MTSLKQAKITNIIRNLLLFVFIIGFVTSTLDKTNLNFNEISDFNKLIEGDLSFLKNKHLFVEICIKLEYEYLENNENLVNTITFKIIKKILRDIYNENNPKKEINILLNIIINNIVRNSEHNIYNDFFQQYILHLTNIYSNYRYNDFYFENFNEKIIPIINKIIYQENNNNSNIDMQNLSKKNLLIKFIDFFRIFTSRKTFFLIWQRM